jgi:hypothetical protein
MRALVLAAAAIASVGFGVSVVSARPKPVLTGQTCHGTAPTPITLPNLPSAPDPSLVAILGVLRRPQLPADVPPASRLPNPFMEGAEVAYERLLATTAHGVRFYLVPAFVAPSQVPTNCTPPLTPQELLEQQALQQQLTQHPRFELFLSELTAGGAVAGGGAAGSTAAEIQAGLGVSSSFGGGGSSAGRYETESGVIDGLVPDGVAGVELTYRHRAPRTLAVSDNFFVLTVSGRVKRPKPARSPHGPPLTPASPFPPSTGPIAPIAPIAIVWRDAHGDAIKTIRQPAYCAGRQGPPLARCLKTLPRP